MYFLDSQKYILLCWS